MKIIKPLTLGILHKPFQVQKQNHLCILALGFFRLSEGKKEVAASRFLIESQAYPKVLPQLPEGQPLDMVMPKGQSEFLLCGNAYAPEAKPVTELYAGVQVGDQTKVLRVIGDRDWYYGELSAFKISKPQPFSKMPIGYERAFGGTDYDYNSIGRGYNSKKFAALFGKRTAPMPNLEYPQTPVRSYSKTSMPASFGPMDIMWKQRFKWVGTYDQHWIENNFPNLADNADMRLHNQAAEDQRTSRPWSGGEPYQLRCLHPQHPEICGHLPSFRVRGILQTQPNNHKQGHQKQDENPELKHQSLDACQHQSLDFKADTVWFFPDSDTGVMLYRAVAPISTPDATDAKALLLAYEHLHDSPRPDSHYIQQMSARMDREQVAGQVLNEAALIPTQPESVKLARAKRKQARAEAVKTKTDKIIAELEKDLDVPDAGNQQEDKPQLDTAKPEFSPEIPAFEMPEELHAQLSLEDIADGGIDLTSAFKKIEDQKASLEAKRDEELAKLEASLNDHLSTVNDSKYSNNEPAGEKNKKPAGEKNKKPDTSDETWEDVLKKATHLPLDLHPDTGSRASDVEQLIELLESDSFKDEADSKESDSKEADSKEADSKEADSKETKDNLDKLEPMQRAAKRAQTLINKERKKLPENLSIKLGAWFKEQVLTKQAMAGRDLADVSASGLDLSGMDLREVNFEGANLSCVNFEKANLFGANFLGANIQGANFSHANLEEANLSQSHAQKACFNHARMVKTMAVEANLTQASFQHADLSKAMLNKASLTEADLSETTLMQTLMGEIKANGSNWSGAEMKQTVLPKASLEHANFAGADMERVICSGVKAGYSQWQKCTAVRSFFGGDSIFAKSNWQGAVFKTCGFRGVDFQAVKAEQATFFQCDFGNAVMTESVLANSVLCRSLFSEANLEHADLRQADLHQAICRGTDFTEADLSESSLVLADMSHTVLLNTRLRDVVERV